jgi:hypothetical protein
MQIMHNSQSSIIVCLFGVKRHVNTERSVGANRREANRLRRLMIANETQCTTLYVTHNVAQFTIEHFNKLLCNDIFVTCDHTGSSMTLKKTKQ